MLKEKQVITNNFKRLYNELNELISKSARFRRVVLHTHSPDSHDFGRGTCDSTLNDKTKFLNANGEELFLEYFENKFDLVAITDHAKAGYACRLAKDAKARQNKICVLPGMELNVRLAPPFGSLRLHLLAIFPQDKDLGEIERIFPEGIPADSARTGNEEITLLGSLAEFTERIRKHRGLCIAAHVDNPNGIRYLFRQTGKDTLKWFNPDQVGTLSDEDRQLISDDFKDYLVAAQFDGIEVSKENDRMHYTWETEPESGLKHRVPVFLTFDTHTIEEISQRADRATFVKMAEVSWNGLASAIKFPDTRIRFSVDRTPPPHILGIEIIGTDDSGFFDKLTIGFAENLNCIIGPRGSGKSTIIDAIRYAFGYNRTLDELESEDLKSAIIARQNRNLKKSIIRIAYTLSVGNTHFLEATYDSKSGYVTKVFDLDGNLLHVVDVEKSGQYPLRLFGWSEIETLGRDPARQLDLLDKLVTGLAPLQENQSELRQKLSANMTQIQNEVKKLSTILKQNNEEVRRYKEYKQEFERLNTTEVKELFASLDASKERLSVLEKIMLPIETHTNSIKQIKPSEVSDLLKSILVPESNSSNWWTEIDNQSIHLFDTQILLDSKLQEISTLLADLRQRISQISTRTNNEIADIEKRIRESVSADPNKQVLADSRSEAKKRLERVETQRVKYQDTYQNIETLLEQRQDIIDQLVRQHENISKLREAKKIEIEEQLNKFQTNEMAISLSFFS